jgi:hypothetical protein
MMTAAKREFAFLDISLTSAMRQNSRRVYSILIGWKIPKPGLRIRALRCRWAALTTLFGVIVVMGLGGAALAAKSVAAAGGSGGRPVKPVPLPSNLTIPHYNVGTQPFRNGETLIYDASWEGIPAAQVKLIISHPATRPDFWAGQMWLNTSKVVDPLYRMRDYVREDFKAETLRPAGMYMLQHEKKRLDEWRVKFDDADRLVTSIKKNREGRVWTRLFSGGEPWGPFSAAMLALSQPLKPQSKYIFDVFSGGNRYVFAFDVQAREKITTALGTFNTLRIEPSVVWLSQGNFRSDASETLVWVTDDSYHLPVRIESAVFIGSVRADLTDVKNGPQLRTVTAGAAPAKEPSQRIAADAPVFGLER